MLPKEVYYQRRQELRKKMNSGILLIPGNEESAMNYRANTYHYRQDSTFLYYFGINKPGFFGVCDVDAGKDILYGDDFDISDVIWMGDQPKVRVLAAGVGVEQSGSLSDLGAMLTDAMKKGRKVQILPPYRGDQILTLANLLGVASGEVDRFVSTDFIRAVVSMRSVKDDFEIAEIEKALEVARLMHTTAMQMGFPGNVEQELVGAMEGIASSHGGPVSFPVILSMDGQTLHNHFHGNELTGGRLVVCDAGAETSLGYASDITRTFPVGGKFTPRQADIYNIVLEANTRTIAASLPGKTYREVHLEAARIIAGGLKDLGIMKGDVEEAVAAGAHALFFPHGLGHMLGLDVHDMEGLGENYVGYTDDIVRSDQFGLAYLRLGRTLEPGFVVTNEPGCYFIPQLIDLWKKEKKHEAFINYAKVEEYRFFGGIRIEDDVLITDKGSRVLGTPIPKTVEEVEETMRA
ncbi:MAG: aminopeptidase P family protein [Bacteroidales bacterium]